MPSLNILHDQLTGKYGDIVESIVCTKDGEPLEVQFKGEVADDIKQQVQADVDAFDLAGIDPDPEKFLDAVADASNNTGLYLIAVRLARFAKHPSKSKQKFAEHSALPEAQKNILRTAAQAAGITLE